jgi:two-component system response regulator MprA
MAMRVLLAEDDRAVREALTRALELEGHAVDAVCDGEAALEALRTFALDELLARVRALLPRTVDGDGVDRATRRYCDDGWRWSMVRARARFLTGSTASSAAP